MTDTITRTCIFCEEQFQSKSPHANYCSRYHKERARDFRKTGYRSIHPKRCPECHKAFIGRQASAIYCTDTCRHKRKKAEREKLQKIFATKSAKFKQKIYFRDEGLCGVCGEPILLSHKYPHPESLTLDHIVPLSKGGAHSQYNIQLAHWTCNINKSDKLIPSQTVTTPTPHAG